MPSSQPSKNASDQSLKFARQTSSGRYVNLSKHEVDTSGEASGDYANYTVHIRPNNQPETSVATKAEEQTFLINFLPEVSIA